jgi:signal transduction histidine kinase
VLTVRANAVRRAAEEDAAFRIGEGLIEQVQDMIALTTSRLEENTQKAMNRIDRTKYILYGLVALGPLVSAVLGFVFILGLTRPVKVLVASTRKLKGGELDHRVPHMKDEFGELATAFNEMAGSLKEQVHKMQRAEQMVVVGELAAGLAHEIKNPMAGIKVAMSVLSEEAYISPEDKVVLQKVVAEITQLDGLMKSFLNFAKPQKPRLEPVNVNQVLNTTLAFHLKHQAVVAGGYGKIEIVKEFGEIPPTLADPTQLQQVFLNLFLNAKDAMPTGGTLRVATENGNGVRITIADTGSGIAQEYIHRIYDPFFTTKNSARDGQRRGTGLGLSVTYGIVQEHAGKIRVQSHPGEGTTFILEFPLIRKAVNV